MALPAIGSAAPAFTLPNQDGRPVSLSDYAGKNVLLWFFPRAYGKNCTIQAGGIRDRGADFAGQNAVVLGITWSTPEDLKSWGSELGLANELLSDTEHTVARAYGAADNADQERPSRVSILVGPDGRVAGTYVVSDVEGHAAQILADLN